MVKAKLVLKDCDACKFIQQSASTVQENSVSDSASPGLSKSVPSSSRSGTPASIRSSSSSNKLVNGTGNTN